MHSHAAGSTHQGFPVLADDGSLVGVVTRRDVLDPATAPQRALRELCTRPPIVIHDDNSLREAADLMVIEKIGRLPVVLRANPREVVGILTRSDLLEAHRRRLSGAHETEQTLETKDLRPRWPSFGSLG
jgi:CIC family chloride channel protein